MPYGFVAWSWFCRLVGLGVCGGLVWLIDACPASLGCVFFGQILLGPLLPLRVGGLFRVSVACLLRWVGCHVDIYGEFDSGSGRTLAACLTHASRTVIPGLALVDQWRTGE